MTVNSVTVAEALEARPFSYHFSTCWRLWQAAGKSGAPHWTSGLRSSPKVAVSPYSRARRTGSAIVSAVQAMAPLCSIATLLAMADTGGFDAPAMVERFRQRAKAVRERGMPPIEGPERVRFQSRRNRTSWITP